MPVAHSAFSGLLEKKIITAGAVQKLPIADQKLGASVAIALANRNPKAYKLLQSWVAVLLWRSGCTQKVFSTLRSIGICQTPTNARRCVDRIAKQFDAELEQWKKTTEDETRCTVLASDCDVILEDLGVRPLHFESEECQASASVECVEVVKDIQKKRALLEKDIMKKLHAATDQQPTTRVPEETTSPAVTSPPPKPKPTVTVAAASVATATTVVTATQPPKSPEAKPVGTPRGSKKRKSESNTLIDIETVTPSVSKPKKQKMIATGVRGKSKLYCICKTPYDSKRFYIGCDRCQDWFHGRCVGILQSEAEQIERYICPNCQSNSQVNAANQQVLSSDDYDQLKGLLNGLKSHSMAWLFMEPVNPAEAPDYYTVVREPMDLSTIERKLTKRRYTKLSDFIGD
ncbi:PREDICTED: nucleosome-remodeling factor subunit BPTF-like, partial [Priapulus caudatus]|uniref:Nucleosome-remodeling factor subunit BPTF-like n=1 Tax=Priapulus caudatus TaxID=37621 RepID=A0ABM1F2J5_PRICU